MTATTMPTGRRTAATWVGATGAFLLVAAAAVFVAVRWDTLTETAKLALVGGLTGAFLVGGRSIRRTLPAMGDVLFHLGAFLVPVDLLGVCLRTDVDWRVTVLAEGLVGAALFTTLARMTGSVVLRWAAIGSGMFVAAGVAAVTPAPATLVLAALAVAAELVGAQAGPHGRTLRRAAVLWAVVAGLAPALGAVAGSMLAGAGVVLGSGTLAELGLTSAAQQSVALASGVLAAYVLARQAGARRDLRLAYLALASVVLGVGTTAIGAELAGSTWLVGLGGLFVAIEVAGLLYADDDFWGRPLAGLATVTEVGARIGGAFALAGVLAAPLIDVAHRTDVDLPTPDYAIAAALLLTALGWLAADLRRVTPSVSGMGRSLAEGGRWAEGTVWTAISVVAAVEVATMASIPTAIALVGVAAVALAARRTGAAEVAAVAVPFALATVVLHPLAAPAIGTAGAAVLAFAARRRDNLILAIDATAVAVAAGFASTGLLPVPAAVGLAAAAAWLTAVALGGGRLGDVARVALLAPLAASAVLQPGDAIGPLVAIAAFFTLDAIRLHRPVIAYGAAATVQPLAMALAGAGGIPLPWAGFAVAVCGVAWAGLAFVVSDRWRGPFVAAAGTGLAIGIILAAGNGQAFSDTLLLVGAVGLAAGLGLRHWPIGHTGGILLTAGLFGHLIMQGVTASEPYVLPVAVQLLVAGWQSRKRFATSSWVAYVPAIALVGGAAVTERAHGGAGWHALVAGAVGVAAVAVGGWRRLAGPMFVGTALVVLVGVRESLSTLAGVPTWAWLGLGGTVLLTVAVLLERTEASPVEAGRRLVEVVAERFS